MIEVRKISKTFLPGTVNEKKALDKVSFSARDGEFITVIGSNGAGKSTLFGAIAGSFPVDSGKIMLDGEDITRMPEYNRSRFFRIRIHKFINNIIRIVFYNFLISLFKKTLISRSMC